MSAALQLQHDAGLILSNLQVLGQFVTSLNRMSSEVMWVAFEDEPFPTEPVEFVAPSHGVQRATYYMAAMGLRCPPSTHRIPGPLPSSSCNACMMCSDCFPDLPNRSENCGGNGDVSEFILPTAQAIDYKTFDMTLCDSVHSGDAMGSFVSLYDFM